jgi:hypothetical protein
MQDKLRALIDRAAFAPSFLSGASLEVCAGAAAVLRWAVSVLSAAAPKAACFTADARWVCFSPPPTQVRDISTNAAWQDAMHLGVPVLAVLLDSSSKDEAEAVLPRPPPRVPAERLQRHLRDALEAAGVDCSGGSGGGSGGGGGSAFTVVSS